MGRKFGGSSRYATYPALYFYLLRFFQLFFSTSIVATIYFLYGHVLRPEPHVPMIFPVYYSHGRATEMHTPWFWLLIHITGHVTLAAVAVTTVLHCCHRLHPWLNMTLNIIILCAWTIGFGGLANYTVRRKIETICGTQLSCRLYNFLLACSILVITTMLAAIVLDVFVLLRESRGAYQTIVTGTAAGEKEGAQDDDMAGPNDSLLGRMSLKPIAKSTLKPLMLVTDPYEPRRG